MEQIGKNVESAVNEHDAPAQSAFKVSLTWMALALIVGYWGDFDALSSHGHHDTWLYPKVILGTLYVWAMNTFIAGELKGIFKSPETGGSTVLFKTNEGAMVFMGIGVLIYSLQLSDENIIGIVGGILFLIACPVWILAQVLVAIKLMKNGAIMLGIAIIASVITFLGAAVVLVETPATRSNVNTYLCYYAIDFIVSMLMYICYNNFFKNSYESTNK